MPPDQSRLATRLTVSQVGELLQLSEARVLELINANLLKAVNVASPGARQRPRWRVRLADLEQFEDSRSNSAASAPKPRRRQRSNRDVVQFV